MSSNQVSGHLTDALDVMRSLGHARSSDGWWQRSNLALKLDLEAAVRPVTPQRMFSFDVCIIY